MKHNLSTMLKLSKFQLETFFVKIFVWKAFSLAENPPPHTKVTGISILISWIFYLSIKQKKTTMENRMHRRFTQSQSLNRLNSLLETVLKYEVLTMRCIFIYLKQPEKSIPSNGVL